MAKHDFSEDDLQKLEEENKIFWDKLEEESDLGVVLSAGAYFENKLNQCLIKYFRADKVSTELLSPSGPLGTLGSKINCVFALRIVDKQEQSALLKLSKIRNRFAHNLRSSFDDASIKDRVFDFRDSYFSDRLKAEMSKSKKFTEAREAFVFTSFCIAMDLSHREVDVWMHTIRYGEKVPNHLDAEITAAKEQNKA